MLNFDLQVSVLESLSATYVDEKRVEISSKDFDVDADVFLLNITYLKREKLIDLSSISVRSTAANTEEAKNDQYCLARATISHAGIKVLSELSANKLVLNTYL